MNRGASGFVNVLDDRHGLQRDGFVFLIVVRKRQFIQSLRKGGLVSRCDLFRRDREINPSVLNTFS